MARIAVIGNPQTDHLVSLLAGRHQLEVVNKRLPGMARTVADRALVDINYLDAAIRSERDGFDAVFFNTVGDYNLPAAKSVLDVPVVGAGEATMRMASLLGERFAIVTVWPDSMHHLYRDRLRDYRLEERCSSVIHASQEAELDKVGTDDSVKSRMQEGNSAIINRLTEACQKAITDSDADTIVLGCTCMAPVATVLDERCELPVLCPSRTGLSVTETLLDLELAPSERAYQTPTTATPKRITALLDGAESRLPDDPESSGVCPMCVPADDDSRSDL